MDSNFMIRFFLLTVTLTVVGIQPNFAFAEGVRLKDLVRVQGAREYQLVGYGLVVGLSGTGDSDRNRSTKQALVNTLRNFDVNISDGVLNSRNVAAVMVTAKIKTFSENGDQTDTEVSSIGDARSLVGGTLILTPLYGPDRNLYALAQGPLSIGGYSFESYDNRIQKNHPTVGLIPKGAVVERSVSRSTTNTPYLSLILEQPDYTTANRIVSAIRSRLPNHHVGVVSPAKIDIFMRDTDSETDLMAAIESINVSPDYRARVIINERTGTIVAGSNVKLGQVSISQGSLNVEISNKYLVSQPDVWGRPSQNVSTVVVPDTTLTVSESQHSPVLVSDGTTVNDLVKSLYQIKLSTRDIIGVLQSIKAAGALHADLVIQ